uniref:Uncharacterized protein n=1 Tax=Meloidogyne incognita TaxID=6306 RepID=A0A914LYE7_MELIC
MEGINNLINQLNQEDDNKEQSDYMNEIDSKWNKIDNADYSNKNENSNHFKNWLNVEHYKTMQRLISDKWNKKLFAHFSMKLCAENGLDLLTKNLQNFVNLKNAKKLINLLKKGYSKIKQNVESQQVAKKEKQNKEVKATVTKKKQKNAGTKFEKKIKKQNITKIKAKDNVDKINDEIIQDILIEKDNKAKEAYVEKIENHEEDIKLEYFTADKNLFDIFNEFIKGKNSITKSFVDVGIYVNEIGKRFEFLENLKKNYIKVFEIYFLNFKKFERMENYWGRIRGKLISKNSDERTRTLGNELHYFLIEILKVTEGKLNKEALNKIKENLYLEKISKYFVDYIGINWSVLNFNQRQFVKEILNLENNKDLNEWTLKIEKRVEELKLIKEQVEIDSSEKLLQVYLHPAGFRPLSENKNWEDASSNVHHNDITTIKSFKTLFEQWKNEKSKQDKEILKFQLFMSSPVNKGGGHIHAIVLAIGAGKVDDDIIKELFIDKTSKSLTSFNSTCSDNSLYCHLFKVK